MKAVLGSTSDLVAHISTVPVMVVEGGDVGPVVFTNPDQESSLITVPTEDFRQL